MISNIFERTLPNGLDLVVSPTNAPVVSVQAWVDAGSIDERPQEAGYCHFIEHMLFKGTKSRTTAGIAGAVEGSGGEMNAFTSFEYTVFHITLSNQRWELANEILCDMLSASAFDKREFASEREVILEEIKRSEDSPVRQLYSGMYRSMYGTAGYGRPVIGYPATIRKSSAAGLKSFWKRWYAPGLITLVVSGDVNPREVEKVVAKTWGRLSGRAPRDRRRNTGFQALIPAAKSRTTHKNFPLNSIRWVGATPACSLTDEILPALDVGSMILGQGESSRLHHRLFREAGLVTSIGSGVWAPAGTGLFSFDAEASLEKQGAFRKALWNEIDRFIKEGPTQEELDRAKVAIETERVYSAQSMDGLANRLGFLQTALGNTRFDLEYLAVAREVSAEEVRTAVKHFLRPEAFREFALLPEKFESSAFWGGTAAGAAPAIKPVRAKSRDFTATGTSHQLPNGTELILFPREDLPVVSVQACVLGGLRAETRDTAGIGSLLSEVWEKGPEGWSSDKLARFLEGRGAQIESFSGRNSIGLSATFLTRYLDDIGPVFVDTLSNPAISDDECDRAKTLALEDIRTLEDEPGRLCGKLFAETLYDAHPYAYPVAGYEASVSALSSPQVRDHHRLLWSGSKAVVAVSGKFNVDKVISMFEKMPKRPVEASRNLGSPLEMEPLNAPRVAEFKKGREQSHLIVGFRGCRVTDKERYDLRVLATVLGGQSGRLFLELRDKQGLCYTVAPIMFEGIEPGYFGVYIGCDPSKREQALEGIKREIDKLTTKSISTAELTRAREFILGRHHMDMQLNQSIVSTSSFNALYGIGFDEHLRLAARLRSVTGDSLRKLSRKLFTAPSVTAMVI